MHDQVLGHDLVELGEAVDAGGVVLGEDAERLAAVVDDDHGAVGALVDQRERLADRVVGRSVIGVS